MNAPSRWVQAGNSRGRAIARRARRRIFADCCSYQTNGTYIEPGQVYLRHVLFPGNDIWNNRVPLVQSECADCARQYGRGELIDQREANPR